MSTFYNVIIGVVAVSLSVALVPVNAQVPKAKTKTTTAKKPYKPASESVSTKPAAKRSVTKPPVSAKTQAPKAPTVSATPAPTPGQPTQNQPAAKSAPVGRSPVTPASTPTPTAQTSQPARISPAPGRRSSFGLRVGGNYASVTPKNAYLEGLGTLGAKLDFYPGFDVAAALNLSLGRTVSIQPEVQFSQWGLKASVGNEFISTRTNYLLVPLSLRLTFGEQIRFFVQGGGFGYYVLSSQVKIRAGGAEQTGKVDFKEAKFSERAGYGATGGAGILIPVGKSDLVLEGRYQHVLGTFDGTKTEIHPTAISLTVGYFFPL